MPRSQANDAADPRQPHNLVGPAAGRVGCRPRSCRNKPPYLMSGCARSCHAAFGNTHRLRNDRYWVESRLQRGFATTPLASVTVTILIQPARSGVCGQTLKLPQRLRSNEGCNRFTLAGRMSGPSASPEGLTTPSKRLVPIGHMRRLGVPLVTDKRPSTQKQRAVAGEAGDASSSDAAIA